ncbi:MAG: CHAT domain-containing protein [Trichodesmium sp. ALOHA_ZT_67]|nr:CHAT domain-containing protein [Trichodesmium sp. ALOHA_ZT_67]
MIAVYINQMPLLVGDHSAWLRTETSVWSVSDQGTLGLMTEFYTHLNSVKIKSEALIQGQLAMLQGKVVITYRELRGSNTRGVVKLPSAFANIKNQNLSHLYYWEGFTIVVSSW